jgi:hypothetical protein
MRLSWYFRFSSLIFFKYVIFFYKTCSVTFRFPEASLAEFAADGGKFRHFYIEAVREPGFANGSV